MEHRRLQVVHVHRIAGDVPADFIGLADDLPAPYSPAGTPQAEGEGMMVAAGDVRGAAAILPQRRATEFARPDDHGFVEQGTGRDGLSGRQGDFRELQRVQESPPGLRRP